MRGVVAGLGGIVLLCARLAWAARLGGFAFRGLARGTATVARDGFRIRLALTTAMAFVLANVLAFTRAGRIMGGGPGALALGCFHKAGLA